MLMRYWSILLLLARASFQQKDPLNDFCRRFGHQSAIVDDRLYIDGGLVNWNPISQNPRNVSNTWLLWHDLNSSPTGVGVPQLYANISKNASIPTVSGGNLWADEVNKRVYLYGGEYHEVTPNAPEVLSYDILNNTWASEGPPGSSIGSVAWGGNVGISELGRSYVLGGWISNTTVPSWGGQPFASSYLLKYDMTSGDWTNSTGPPDNLGRAEGVMVYLPASDNGLLIYFGGGTTPFNNSTLVASALSTVYVYDIKSSQWYTQNAVGEVPLSRKRFCAGAAWTPDRSSYNIYLYGGQGFENNTTGFDDVYILSLPTFTWIKWWQGSGVGKPHHSLTCNVVHGGQMLIIGGSFPLSDACDSPETWGVHNLDLGKQTGKMWVEYQTTITGYAVPEEVIKVVGGSSTGGATANKPVAGFDNADLSVYFAQKAVIASRTPTRAIPTPTSSPSTPNPTPRKLSTGAIVGIAIGGVAILTLLALLCFCCIRKRSRQSDGKHPTHQAQLEASHASSHPTTYQTREQAHAYAPQYPLPHNNHYQLPADNIPVELSAADAGVSKAGFYSSSTVLENNRSLHSHSQSHSHGLESLVVGSPSLSMASGGVSPYVEDRERSPAPGYVDVVTDRSLNGGGRRQRGGMMNRTYYSP